MSLTPKKIIHLKGNNGIGKTTLLKILTNIISPDEGEVFWNGKNIKKNPYYFYKDLTFIMDSNSSNSHLTVKENMLFWCKIFKSKIKDNEIDSILGLLLLDKYKDTPISYLSYGELKKLELSRLIIERKKLWILDEPYIGLDNSSSELLCETFINHLKLDGMIIFTSHIIPPINTLDSLNLNLKNDK